jgi:hypothetical protein
MIDFSQHYDEKTIIEIQEALQERTPFERIRWRPISIRGTEKDGYTATGLAYADARFTQDRLDSVCGAFNWQSQSKVEAGLLLVGISIRWPKTSNWITKWDTGADEAIKDEGGEFDIGGRGAFSQGFKRAGYQWGIGRDTYYYPHPRLECAARQDNHGNLRFLYWRQEPDPRNIVLQFTRRESEIGEGPPPRGPKPKAKGDKAPAAPEPKSESAGSEFDMQAIPATSSTFYTIAYGALKYARENAASILKGFSKNGEIDYQAAIIKLEEGLPETDRLFTKQVAEAAEAAKTAEAAEAAASASGD